MTRATDFHDSSAASSGSPTRATDFRDTSAGRPGSPGLSRKSVRSPRRGFTLVEAIAALGIISAIGSVSSMLIFTAVSSYQDASMHATLQSEASGALERVFRELCGVNRDASAAVLAPQISTVAATSITWNTNTTLSLTGSNLSLSESGGPSIPILRNVTSLVISAYDESNALLATPLNGAATQPIRRIQIQVSVSRSGAAETLRMRMFLRCTMIGAPLG